MKFKVKDTMIDFIKRVAETFNLGTVEVDQVDNDIVGISVGDYYISYEDDAIESRSLLGITAHFGFIATACYQTFNDEWGYDADEIEIDRKASLGGIMESIVADYKTREVSSKVWAIHNEFFTDLV